MEPVNIEPDIPRVLDGRTTSVVIAGDEIVILTVVHQQRRPGTQFKRKTT